MRNFVSRAAMLRPVIASGFAFLALTVGCAPDPTTPVRPVTTQPVTIRSEPKAAADPAAAARRTDAFRAARAARQTETAEDYVELIGDLIAEHGEARLTDVAERLGVSDPTATKIITRLREEGLIGSLPYRALSLTAKGTAMADRSRHRHRIVHDFLRAIGVSERTADADSEGMEHHVSEETMVALAALTAKLTAKD